MASLIFDPSVDSRPTDPGGTELKQDRRSFVDQLPWTIFLQQIHRSGLSLAQRKFSHVGYIVGHGTSSEVYRYCINSVEDRMDTMNLVSGEGLELGTVVALKRIKPMRNNEEGGVLRAAQKEIRVMTTRQFHNHKYIVRLHSLFWEDRDGQQAFWPTLVTEFCDCNLLELVNVRKLKIRTKLELYLGIHNGLHALHIAGYIHGDIKCENILIQRSRDGIVIPKLSDFGSSVHKNMSVDLMVVIAGTDPWCAPECVGENGERQKVPIELAPATDIFSLGMVLWMMICDGINPFQELYDLEDEWIEANRWEASQRSSDHFNSNQNLAPRRLQQHWENDLQILARATTNKKIQ